MALTRSIARSSNIETGIAMQCVKCEGGDASSPHLKVGTSAPYMVRVTGVPTTTRAMIWSNSQASACVSHLRRSIAASPCSDTR